MEHYGGMIRFTFLWELRAKRIGKRIPILVECFCLDYCTYKTENTLKLLQSTTSTAETMMQEGPPIPVLVSVDGFRLLVRSVL